MYGKRVAVYHFIPNGAERTGPTGMKQQMKRLLLCAEDSRLLPAFGSSREDLLGALPGEITTYENIAIRMGSPF
jgi:hypothetical protein